MIVCTIYKGLKNQYIQFAKGKNFVIFSTIFDLYIFSVSHFYFLSGQSLLSLVCAGLKNKLWSEVEPVAYYKAVRCLLSSLLPLLDHHENKTPQVQSCYTF